MTNNNVPVALFVFNRYENLFETITCLKDNHIDNLYIFCDGPRNAEENEAVQKVRQLVRSIDWTTPRIFERQNNLGLSGSIELGLAEVFKTSDRVVVVEDDVCVEPSFYEYMCHCLKFYENNDRIAGITGLRYPFSSTAFDNYPHTAFFAPRFSSWGWATWRRFWLQRETKHEVIKDIVESKGLALNNGGQDMVSTYKLYLSGELKGSWDVNCAANMLINDLYFVWPTHNMVRNTGLSSGTHASLVEPSWKLDWEKTPKSFSLPYEAALNDKIMKEFLSFFDEIIIKGDSMPSSIRKFGGKIKRRLRGSKDVSARKPHPSEYTTTDGPLEVPVQIESYFIALNKYIEEGDKVLDVGSGLGYGLNLLSIKAGEVSGVDIDQKAIDYAEKRVRGRNPKLKDLKVYDGYNLPYADKSFDVITSIDVIEHVEDYDRFIDELLRVAKKAVLISTPNRREEHTNPDGTPKNHWHLREWSRAELDKIIAKHEAKIQWHHVNGPWEGPFTVSSNLKEDTQTLTPALLPKKDRK